MYNIHQLNIPSQISPTSKPAFDYHPSTCKKMTEYTGITLSGGKSCPKQTVFVEQARVQSLNY